MSIAFPILSGVAGAVAGWLSFRFVDWAAADAIHDRLETDVTPLRRSLHLSMMIAAGATLAVALAAKFGTPGILFFVNSGLTLVLLGVTFFDLRKHEIPHIVTLPGILAGLFIGTFLLPLGFTGSIAGLAAGGGILLVATIVEAMRKKEIGGGDWKYAAMIGSFLGPQKVLVALVLTGVFGFGAAVVLAFYGNAGRPQALGPWLSAGAVASILLG